jgi:hypothetical protein
MSNSPLKSYINGAWVLPATSTAMVDAVNPATEEVCAIVAVCGSDDADRAVHAARAAFDGFAATTLEHRIALVEKLIGQTGIYIGVDIDLSVYFTTEDNNQLITETGDSFVEE